MSLGFIGFDLYVMELTLSGQFTIYIYKLWYVFKIKALKDLKWLNNNLHIPTFSFSLWNQSFKRLKLNNNLQTPYTHF